MEVKYILKFSSWLIAAELSYKPSHLHPKPTLIITASHNWRWKVLEDLDSWRNPVTDLPHGVKRKIHFGEKDHPFCNLQIWTLHIIFAEGLCVASQSCLYRNELGDDWLKQMIMHVLSTLIHWTWWGVEWQMVLLHQMVLAPSSHTPSSAKPTALAHQ